KHFPKRGENRGEVSNPGGMDDPRFVAFVRSVAGVDHYRFLTDAQVSVVLVEMVLVNLMGLTIRELPMRGEHVGA
ncbi:hypothetical protein, partial [Thauera sp.]|uniref:hypothetical protein n=1 Tax=Thauera sp. TaxID=1905334 RepID=UPI002CAED827